MIDAKVFDNMAQQLGKLLPAGVEELKSDFENNARAVIQNTLSKMDLITREEFDVQTALLQKTALRVKGLEKRISKLESSTNQSE